MRTEPQISRFKTTWQATTDLTCVCVCVHRLKYSGLILVSAHNLKNHFLNEQVQVGHKKDKVTLQIRLRVDFFLLLSGSNEVVKKRGSEMFLPFITASDEATPCFFKVKRLNYVSGQAVMLLSKRDADRQTARLSAPLRPWCDISDAITESISRLYYITLCNLKKKKHTL